MTTEERLEKLEKELARAKRRNRRLLAVAGLVVGAVTLAWIVAGTANRAEAQGGGVPAVIRANAFVLVDEKGKTRAELSMGEYGPGLLLVDENGKTRATLTVDKDWPWLALADENGKTRAMLAVGKNGPVLGLLDENGKVKWQTP